MAEFSRHVASPRIEAPVEDQSRAEAGSKREEQQIGAAAPSAESPFRQRTGVGIVAKPGGEPGAPLELVHNGQVVPARQIGWGEDASRTAIQRAAAADADPDRPFRRKRDACTDICG